MPKKKAGPKKKVNSGSSQLEYWANETEYELDTNHPHRQLILDELKKLEPLAGVLEIGCNIGQNLSLIAALYPETQLAGVDINARAIAQAQQRLPKAILKVANATYLPFSDKEFDVCIIDAVWMYIEDINQAILEAIRVSRRAIILIDFDAKRERLIGHTFVRDYGKLLTLKGQKVNSIKITTWLNPKWNKYGRLYVSHPQ